MPESPQTFSTVPEFAARRRFSIATARREIASGRLPVVKIGRLTRITPAGERAWEESLATPEAAR